MEDFVTITMSEDEFEAVIEWLGNESINSGLGDLYTRLLAAVEAADVEEA
jgi:hypothetical protein